MFTRLMIGFATAILLALAGCSSSTAADEAAIAAVMRATWERPDAPLGAGPIVVAGDRAVADWTQAAKGGRALLERRQAGWAVVYCGGEILRRRDGLKALGLDNAVATELASKLAHAERDVELSRLRAMAKFSGLVRMPEQTTDSTAAHATH